VVERSPEKAGVGGSTPSLATTFSITRASRISLFGCNSFQTSFDTCAQTAQFVDRSLLAWRHKLLIDILDRRMPESSASAHVICTGYFQPDCEDFGDFDLRPCCRLPLTPREKTSPENRNFQRGRNVNR
jgi:hypothetical protein